MKIDEKKAELLKQFYENSENLYNYYMGKSQDEEYEWLLEKLKQQLDTDLNNMGELKNEN